MSYEMSDDESDDEVIPWTALASSQSKKASLGICSPCLEVLEVSKSANVACEALIV